MKPNVRFCQGILRFLTNHAHRHSGNIPSPTMHKEYVRIHFFVGHGPDHERSVITWAWLRATSNAAGRAWLRATSMYKEPHRARSHVFEHALEGVLRENTCMDYATKCVCLESGLEFTSFGS